MTVGVPVGWSVRVAVGVLVTRRSSLAWPWACWWQSRRIIVGVAVGVTVWVGRCGVAVGVLVSAPIIVGVAVGVTVWVRVAVGVLVSASIVVGVAVGVRVAVGGRRGRERLGPCRCGRGVLVSAPIVVGVAVGVRVAVTVAVGVIVWVRVAVGVAVGVRVAVGAATQRAMVLLSNVTAPFRAKTLPVTLAPVVRVALVSTMTLPANALAVPKVAELPTCQNTLQLGPPLLKTTDEFGCGRQRAPYLENEDRIGVALDVEGELSRQLRRRVETVDARREGESAQILTSQIDIACLAGKRVVRNRDIALRLLCDRITGVDRAWSNDDPWGKASNCRTW